MKSILPGETLIKKVIILYDARIQIEAALRATNDNIHSCSNEFLRFA
jgi:hypothetical protein